MVNSAAGPDRKPSDDGVSRCSFLLPWIWPLISAASMSRLAAAGFDTAAKALAADRAVAPHEASAGWPTAHTVAAELPSMRLRDFSRSAAGPATIICAPFALHGATVADFAAGHSVVERLLGEGLQR